MPFSFLTIHLSILAKEIFFYELLNNLLIIKAGIVFVCKTEEGPNVDMNIKILTKVY